MPDIKMSEIKELPKKRFEDYLRDIRDQFPGAEETAIELAKCRQARAREDENILFWEWVLLKYPEDPAAAEMWEGLRASRRRRDYWSMQERRLLADVGAIQVEEDTQRVRHIRGHLRR